MSTKSYLKFRTIRGMYVRRILRKTEHLLDLYARFVCVGVSLMVFPRRNWTPLPTLLLLFRLFIFSLHLPSTVSCAYCGMLLIIYLPKVEQAGFSLLFCGLARSLSPLETQLLTPSPPQHLSFRLLTPRLQ